MRKATGAKPVCPECRDGKHRNCAGEAWDGVLDKVTVCECTQGVCRTAWS